MLKKIFFIILILLGLSDGYNTYAQVCKISNSNNDNVEVFSAYVVDGSRVEVTVGNDSQNVSANVTVEVVVTYKNKYGNVKTMKYAGKDIAKPNTPTVINIPINPTHQDSSDYKAESVKVLNITGTKCM